MMNDGDIWLDRLRCINGIIDVGIVIFQIAQIQIGEINGIVTKRLKDITFGC